MIYLDTSYIVKCYVAEPGSAQVLEWLAGRTGLVCAWHGRLEFFAAIHRHFQNRRLTATEKRRVLHQLAVDEEQGLWNWLPLSYPLVKQACDVVSRLTPHACLRAADALHLVAATHAGCREIYSHDRHLLAAASHFGITARDILPS